ncbi:MAG: hypothetical protein E7329_10115 [Clostridiales bacterium]|nr:hypothetical protein [Clostridiales bacterium]
MKCEKLALGLDIGTTSISAAVVNIETGENVQAVTKENRSALAGKPFEKKQDASWILDETAKLAEELSSAYSLAAIGVTGQMHGILYVDEMGHPVSPLYTWQDERAGQEIRPGVSYCQEIFEITGEHIQSGYGWATHYYQMKNGLVPFKATSLCTVIDALAMRLTGKNKPILHPSNAASLGLYDAKRGCFKKDALAQIGVNEKMIPAIASDEKPLGRYRGLPVSYAIGDNQAGVYGSLVNEEESVLVNFGTGSQVSMVTEKYTKIPGLETRPYIGEKYLLSGAALCGGKAYAMAEKFFRTYALALGLEDAQQYSLMQRLAEEVYSSGHFLDVNTAFCGTRLDPSLRGSIQGIGEDNFTPGHMILGVLRGMAEELFSMYETMPRQGRSMLAASGNGIRKNPVLQRVLKDRFQMPLLLPGHQEEAAFGAALYAAVVSGVASFSDAKACIAYAEM